MTRAVVRAISALGALALRKHNRREQEQAQGKERVAHRAGLEENVLALSRVPARKERNEKPSVAKFRRATPLPLPRLARSLARTLARSALFRLYAEPARTHSHIYVSLCFQIVIAFLLVPATRCVPVGCTAIAVIGRIL